MARPKNTTPCKVDGCEGKHHAKGYCHRHDQQMRKNGKIHNDEVKYTRGIKKECSVIGCHEITTFKFCKKHSSEIKKAGKKDHDRKLINYIHKTDNGGGSSFNGDWDY